MASANLAIQLSGIGQARAVRDVVEHRVLLATTDPADMVELEVSELWELVVFLHRLTSLIDENE